MIAVLALLIALQAGPPAALPPEAAAKLRESLKQAAAHKQHLWRDTPPFDGTLVNAYVEIPMGDRRKYEFDMAKNDRAIDRIIPEPLGGYPINYGIVPQTISYDGDPFDVLVLGPPAKGGELIAGVVAGACAPRRRRRPCFEECPLLFSRRWDRELNYSNTSSPLCCCRESWRRKWGNPRRACSRRLLTLSWREV